MKEHYYFIGIAGHTIRGLALCLREQGSQVSGLDETAVPPGSLWLDEHKITWFKSFQESQLESVTQVIVTGAHATEDHPAIRQARQRGIMVKSWAQVVGEITKTNHTISVAGTHGKTTTTSLIAWLLESAGKHPDYLIGIQPFNFETSVRFNNAAIAVLEGDEYRASNLESLSKVQYFHSDTLVLTSLEHDHPDMFPDLGSVIKRFAEIVMALPGTGLLVANATNSVLLDVASGAGCEVVTYGGEKSDYMARNISYEATGIEFDIETSRGVIGRIAVPLYGKHNVLNVLAAVAVGVSEKLSFEEVIQGALAFKGAYRRFNILTKPKDSIIVIDDYAHHPTEVKTTIEAAKLHFPGRRLVVVFRPHTYSRTKALLHEYWEAFSKADLSYITDIEGAREADHEQTVSGEDLAKGIGKSALFEPDRARLYERIKADLVEGDVILCMTVSGYNRLADELAYLVDRRK